LFGYDFTVEYRPGKLNGVAGALSRCEKDIAAIHAISAPTFQLFDRLRTKVQDDPEVAAMHTQLEGGIARAGCSQFDGLMLFWGKIFIPKASTLSLELPSHAHIGHESIQKTMTRWWASFYSSQALCRVCEFVQGCSLCQRNNYEHLHLGRTAEAIVLGLNS
jgi:hypothetical protein